MAFKTHQQNCFFKNIHYKYICSTADMKWSSRIWGFKLPPRVTDFLSKYLSIFSTLISSFQMTFAEWGWEFTFVTVHYGQGSWVGMPSTGASSNNAKITLTCAGIPWVGRLDQRTHSDPHQPDWFCDSAWAFPFTSNQR